MECLDPAKKKRKAKEWLKVTGDWDIAYDNSNNVHHVEKDNFAIDSLFAIKDMVPNGTISNKNANFRWT